MSALSLSLRDKDRLRDRESLTMSNVCSKSDLHYYITSMIILVRFLSACPNIVLSFFENFSNLFGIFNGGNTLFTRIAKKCSSFR